jgi:hypothetical protein
MPFSRIFFEIAIRQNHLKRPREIYLLSTYCPMIETVHLFPELDEKLISLLKSLSPDDWNKPTVARLWSVKDVAAHLLDGNIRVLSMTRDQHMSAPDRDISSYQDLVAYLNQLNADWVKAARRISPAVLTELLETTGKQYSQIMAGQDLHIDAPFSVAWAGESISKNWFHIAREYTEKWHHQQQIRDAVCIDAVCKTGIMTERLFFPMIETFLMGLPHTYRHTDAPEGTSIRIDIALVETLERHIVKRLDGWKMEKQPGPAPEAAVSMDADTAWKLFTKAIKPEEALQKIYITGNKDLAAVSLNLVAVMA